jgi:predicted dinucleotide-binding enzyme
MKIGMIGKGNVGSHLSKGLISAGHEVKFAHRDPKESAAAAAAFGELIIMAVPYSEVRNVAKDITGFVEGKVVVDVTNALGPGMSPLLGSDTSAAEEVQKLFPKSRVVKAFNYVFAQNMETGKFGKEALTAFVAGDDADAKKKVMLLAKQIGFEPVDAGPIATSRYLEAMAILIINLGYGMKMGPDIGFRLIRQ